MGDKTQAFEAATARLFDDWHQNERGEWVRDESSRWPWWRIGALAGAAVASAAALGYALVLLVWQIGHRGGAW